MLFNFIMYESSILDRVFFNIIIIFMINYLTVFWCYATSSFDDENYLENLYLEREVDIYDPFESTNRKIYRFNTIVDNVAIKPAAKIYRFITPNVAKRRISSVLSNLQEPLHVVHGLLTLNPKHTFTSLFRFIINTTIGVLGLFDIAELNNLKRYNSTFGDVLAHYNVKLGPYLVLPILGPSSLRNGIGTGVDFFINPINNVDVKHSNRYMYSHYGLYLISERESLLDATDAIEKASIDPYSMVRSIYFQKQRGENE